MTDVMVDQHSEQTKDFYVRYANAMSKWQNVELYSYWIFILALGCHSDRAASIVYNGIYSFPAKLHISDLILRHYLGEESELFQTWADIHSEIGKCYQERSVLAHYMFVLDLSVPELEFGEMFLTPPMSKPLKKKKENISTRITDSDLDQMADHFSSVYDRLRKFYADLSSDLTSLRKST